MISRRKFLSVTGTGIIAATTTKIGLSQTVQHVVHQEPVVIHSIFTMPTHGGHWLQPGTWKSFKPSLFGVIASFIQN